MKPDRLLAKSTPREKPDSILESSYLKQHLIDVYQASQQVLECTVEDQLQALQLSISKWKERFARAVSLAAALHDLGKANDHFQGMLQPDELPERNGIFQGLRHEWCTFYMLQNSKMESWLKPCLIEENDWNFVQWAISGHHPAFHHSSPPRKVPDGCGSEMALYLGHLDFHDCLSWIGETFQIGNPPSLSNKNLSLVGSNNAFSQICHCFIKQSEIWERMGEEERRFAASIKACVINADIAGSALPHTKMKEELRRTWIPSAFQHVPTEIDLSNILAARLKCTPKEIDTNLRPFQKDVADKAGKITFVKAGCGTGKTLAAYNWARHNHPRKRLYICYPTTGTATEGYRDYLYNQEEQIGKLADLFHSRKGIDFEIILGVERDGKDEEDASLCRIQSLAAWSTPIVSCTVDTVLGITQNSRRGLYAWSALAGAAFVFDEIHSYDDRLFGALLRFLETLQGVPVLLMTASLPEARYQSLQACLKRIGKELTVISGPTDLEELPRYHIQPCEEKHDPVEAIKTELDAKGKVLWVCNTVNRAMDAADRAANAGLNPILYHSRFKYTDRVEQHCKVIETFDMKKNPNKSALAICTQVAEMSLDLSATLLVTDLAPVPSLIQRLGRLNRRAESGDLTRPFIVIEPRDDEGNEMHLPYTPADLDKARRWLSMLPKDGISQSDLSNTWEQDEETKTRRPAYVPSAWIDGGPATQVLELREGTPGVVVIRSEDYEAYKKAHEEVSISKVIQKLSIPMTPPPRHLDWNKWDKKKGVLIAPANTIDYDKERGAQWQKEQK